MSTYAEYEFAKLGEGRENTAIKVRSAEGVTNWINVTWETLERVLETLNQAEETGFDL